jgi:hypothetical protein
MASDIIELGTEWPSRPVQRPDCSSMANMATSG